jgi:hypothetical protein
MLAIWPSNDWLQQTMSQTGVLCIGTLIGMKFFDLGFIGSIWNHCCCSIRNRHRGCITFLLKASRKTHLSACECSLYGLHWLDMSFILVGRRC